MTLRFNSYRLYFRIWLYLLPPMAFLLAAYARFYDATLHPRPVGYDYRFYVVVCLLTTAVWSIVAEQARLFHIEEMLQEHTGVRKSFTAVASTYLVVVCILFFYRQQDISRIFFAISCVLLLIMTVTSRILFRSFLRGKHSKKPIRVLIVGADKYALNIAERMAQIPLAPTVVAAHLRLPEQAVTEAAGYFYDYRDREKWIGVPFDEVVIAIPPSKMEQVATLVAELESLHVPIRTVLDFGEIPIVRDRLFQLGDLQFLDLATTPLESAAYFALKRAFDICFALTVLLLGLPLLVTIALAIKLTSSGPVLFRQERVGLNGRAFMMYKFRTMRVAPRAVTDQSHTQTNDPRRTKLGIWLRKTSLDEVPQFLNVLKGDMSVVGPRPELTFFANKYSQELLNYAVRHRLKVGITGWAQVNGWRGNTSIERRVDADLYYLQNWTFWLDLRIVGMTIVRGMIADQAY